MQIFRCPDQVHHRADLTPRDVNAGHRAGVRKEGNNKVVDIYLDTLMDEGDPEYVAAFTIHPMRGMPRDMAAIEQLMHKLHLSHWRLRQTNGTDI